MSTARQKNMQGALYPALKGDHSADVVVIGGGITGVLAAYVLSKEGKSVVLLESGRVGEGVTSLTTAFITHVVDTSLAKLVDMFGARKAKELWTSGADAIDLLEDIILSERIKCDFMRCPAILFAQTQKQFEKIEEDCRVAKRMGFPVELRVFGALPFKNYGRMKIHGQAKFHAGKFVPALAAKAAKYGAVICEHSEVIGIRDISAPEGGAAAGGVEVTTAYGAVRARDVIIATYQPFENPSATRFKKGMYVSYALKGEIPAGALEEGLYWDYSNPYYYFRVDAASTAHDEIIAGGLDHRKEIRMNPIRQFDALKKHMQKLFGDMPFKVDATWKGPILESSDGLPLIGHVSPHRYVATAFSGNGMTYAMVSARLIADLIHKKKNPWEHLYAPQRKMGAKQLFAKAKDYGAEFLTGVVRQTFKRK